MASISLLVLTILLALFLAPSQTLTTYVYTFDSISGYKPTYNIGYILAGHTVMLNLTTQGTDTNFDEATIQLFKVSDAITAVP